jgi:hypothetical protein
MGGHPFRHYKFKYVFDSLVVLLACFQIAAIYDELLKVGNEHFS